MEKNIKKNVQRCITESFYCTRNDHIVNQLYFKKRKNVKTGDNKVLLYSTENHIQFLVITHSGKEYGK